MTARLHEPLEARREILRRRRKLPDPVRRQEAAQATLDKFRGHPFDWSTGHHCVKLAHFHLRQMGLKPPPLPRVRSALAARRALADRGWADVPEMLDSVLPRVAPAAMALGDLAVLPGDEGFHSLMVCVGPRRLFGWRADQPAAVVLEVRFDEIAGAWRVK